MSRYRQINLNLNKSSLYFTRKDMGTVHNKARLHLDKKEQKATLINSPKFSKTNKFNVMKTFR